MSDSLRPYELLHNRLPCPLLFSRVCSNSCPFSRWCHPTTSSSVISFSCSLQSFPASGSFPVSPLFASGGWSIGASASASVLPMNIQGWFPLGLTGLIFLQSTGLSRVFSSITIWKRQFFWHLPFFMVQISHPYMTTRKAIVLAIWTFVSKVTCLLFNMLSLSFPSKEQASFNFMAAVTIRSDFRALQNKICHGFHFFPFYLPWSDGTWCHDLRIWMLSFKSAFSLSSFTLIKRLFSFSSFSAVRLVSSAYLRWLIFLLVMLIPACDSSSLAFHML